MGEMELFSWNFNIISSKSLEDILLTLARVGINLWCILASSSYCASSLTETESCWMAEQFCYGMIQKKKKLNLWLWTLHETAIYIIIGMLNTSDGERPLQFTVSNSVLCAGANKLVLPEIIILPMNLKYTDQGGGYLI